MSARPLWTLRAQRMPQKFASPETNCKLQQKRIHLNKNHTAKKLQEDGVFFYQNVHCKTVIPDVFLEKNYYRHTFMESSLR